MKYTWASYDDGTTVTWKLFETGRREPIILESKPKAQIRSGDSIAQSHVNSDILATALDGHTFQEQSTAGDGALLFPLLSTGGSSVLTTPPGGVTIQLPPASQQISQQRVNLAPSSASSPLLPYPLNNPAGAIGEFGNVHESGAGGTTSLPAPVFDFGRNWPWLVIGLLALWWVLSDEKKEKRA